MAVTEDGSGTSTEGLDELCLFGYSTRGRNCASSTRCNDAADEGAREVVAPDDATSSTFRECLFSCSVGGERRVSISSNPTRYDHVDDDDYDNNHDSDDDDHDNHEEEETLNRSLKVAVVALEEQLQRQLETRESDRDRQQQLDKLQQEWCRQFRQPQKQIDQQQQQQHIARVKCSRANCQAALMRATEGKQMGASKATTTTSCSSTSNLSHVGCPSSSAAGTNQSPDLASRLLQESLSLNQPLESTTSAATSTVTSNIELNNSNSSFNLDHLKSYTVEAWLDQNPLFVHDYFLRKATRQLVEDWLTTHPKLTPTTYLPMSSQADFQSSLLNSSCSPTNKPLQTFDHQQQQQQQQPQPNNLRQQRSSLQCYPTSFQANKEDNKTTNYRLSARFSDDLNYYYRLINTSLNNTNYLNTLNQPISSSSTKTTTTKKSSSGTNTPFRKISATDFESKTGSIFLRPMISTTPDGKPTFLSQHSIESVLTSTASSNLRQEQSGKGDDELELEQSSQAQGVKRRVKKENQKEKEFAGGGGGGGGVRESSELNCGEREEDKEVKEEALSKTGDEVKLIFELVKDICSDLDIRTLLHKILKNIAVLINADKSSLFLVCGSPDDPNRHLVSQLFNVDQDSEVGQQDNSDSNDDSNDPQHNETSSSINIKKESKQDNENNNNDNDNNCVRISWGFGLVGYVAETGETLNIPNCYQDPRFTDTIDQRTGYKTKHMICAPIFDGKRNELVGVAQVINKRDGNPFSEADKIKFERYLQFCGVGLSNAQSYEHCQLENKRNQVLLDLARMVFEEQSTIEEVVYRIMLHTQSLLECQRCQVLLIDDGSDDLDQLLQLTSGCYMGARGAKGPEELLTQYNNLRPEWRPQCHTGSSDSSSTTTTTATTTATLSTSTSTVPTSNKMLPNKNESVNDNNETFIMSAMDNFDDQGPATNNRKPVDESLFSLVFDLECDGNDFVMHTKANKQNSLPIKTTREKASPSCSSSSSSSTNNNNNGQTDKINQKRFPINIGITGHVAMTGETLNIQDAHKCARFDPKVDQNNSNFRHKSILCMPIRNGQRQIIGVSQLINKKNGRPFNKNDQDLFEAFAIFCGLGIHNTLMYEKVLKIMAKQRVTFEVLSYHATAPLEEAKKLHQEQVPSSFALDLHSLKFNDFSLDDQFMLKSCLRFFRDLDLIRRFQIDELVFCNWILSVQKNYRKVTYHPIVGGTGLKASPVRYHNWRHAFNVTQMMFAIMINTQMCQPLGELETLALIIACLCHDLDHRGTNNSFQIKSASPLAQLYSTSTMEHHHFDQCVMILNSQGNQILAKLSPEEYSRVIVLLKEAILATDLANYFQKREHFFQLINSGTFQWKTNNQHRSLLRCMLMTACDVAAITKPWPIQKVVADLVMSEFYQQGDIEKHELNIEPIDDLMNREKMSKLPEMQIGFIESICAPIYSAFARQFPRELSPLLEGCLANRDLWRDLAKRNEEEDKRNKINNSYDINQPTLKDFTEYQSILPQENNDNLYKATTSLLSKINENNQQGYGNYHQTTIQIHKPTSNIYPQIRQDQQKTKKFLAQLIDSNSIPKPTLNPLRSHSICTKNISWVACCKRKSI